MRKISLLILSVFIISFLGCGSGGGAGNGTAQTDATLTTTNAPNVVSATMEGVGFVGMSASFGEIGAMAKPVAYPSSPPLRQIINRIISISKTHGTAAGSDKLQKYLKRSSHSVTGDCSNGGMQTSNISWEGPVEPSSHADMLDVQGTFTFDACKEGTVTMNGIMTMTFKGRADSPTEFSMSTQDYSYIDTLENEDFTMQDFNIVGRNIVFSGDEITSGIITATGAISGISDGEPIYAEMDKLMVTFTSTSAGETISVSGRIRHSCIDGWITVTTNIPIYTPVLAECPTSGEIIITSGGNSIKAKVDSNYDVDIFYNDKLVNTYYTCNDVEGLCEGKS